MQNKFKLILPYIVLLSSLEFAFANNTSYIALSNHIAKKTQLGIAANNIANINTTGFEADEPIFKSVDLKQSARRSNSFVYVDKTFRGGNKGDIKMTYRPLDVAIAGEGYFKVLTPRGYRYTFNGALFMSSESILVNIDGLPFASQGNQPINIPTDADDIRVGEDGIIYADGEEVDTLGIFSFIEPGNMIKEGNNLYSNDARDVLLDDFTIISGALRSSNVNSTKAMVEMVEFQRSAAMTDNLMSGIADLEKSTITKVTK